MSHNQGSRTRNLYVTSVSILLAAFTSSAFVRADSISSPNIALNVDTNRSAGPGAGNVSVTVNTITVAETRIDEYSSGDGRAIAIRVRPGFRLDPTSNVTAVSATFGINGTIANTAAILTPSGLENEVLTFNLTSGGTAGLDTIRIGGIKILIASAVGAAGPGQPTMQVTTEAAGGTFINQDIVAATISKGAPDHLVFSIQPGDNKAGDDLLPQVKIVDFGGNVVTDSERIIDLTIEVNPSAGILSGTSVAATLNGIATWTTDDNLNITAAGVGYTLRAVAGGAVFLTSNAVDSLPFDITAKAPARLVVSRQPLNIVAGDTILIDVSLLDEFDNLVEDTPVNVTLDSAVNTGGWPLVTATSLTKTTVNGIASWGVMDQLRTNKAVTGYRLFVSGAGAPVLTNPFTIAPAAPNALRFVQQPTNTIQNLPINPAVKVEIIDAYGNRTGVTTRVKMTLSTAPCGGNLTGGTVSAINGLATFSFLKVDTPCEDDVLQASADGLIQADSEPFNITVLGGGGVVGCGGIDQGVGILMFPILLLAVGFRHRIACAARRSR